MTSAKGASLSTDADTKKLADQFMTLTAEGSYDKAFALMKPHWPMPAAEIDNLAYQTQSQLKMASERFGKLVGSEFIQTNKIGESYIRYIYIQKFSNHATRWMIVYYRATTEWKVNAVVWDDKTPELFNLKSEQLAPRKD